MDKLALVHNKIDKVSYYLGQKIGSPEAISNFQNTMNGYSKEVQKTIAITVISETDNFFEELESIKQLTREDLIKDPEVEQVFIDEIYHSHDKYKSDVLFDALDARNYWNEDNILAYMQDDDVSFVVRKRCIETLINQDTHKNLLAVKSTLQYLHQKYMNIEVVDIPLDPETQFTREESIKMFECLFLMTLKKACEHFKLAS